jgi:hypothetical protein
MHNFAPNDQLRHAGPTGLNREADLKRPSRVACSVLFGLVVIKVANLLFKFNDVKHTNALVVPWIRVQVDSTRCGALDSMVDKEDNSRPFASRMGTSLVPPSPTAGGPQSAVTGGLMRILP